MKLIKPSFEVLSEINKEYIYKIIEKAARTCYKSESKITENTDSAEQLIAKLIRSGHEAMLEFADIAVMFTCDRGVSHELVRHRIASFAQESTRYVTYESGCTFIIPPWTNIKEGDYDRNLVIDVIDNNTELDEPSLDWISNMFSVEQTYKKMLNSWSPQQARSILPNSTKTDINVKMNIREWRHFFKLRTSNAAHPQMYELTRPLLDLFKSELPLLFNDITYKTL